MKQKNNELSFSPDTQDWATYIVMYDDCISLLPNHSVKNDVLDEYYKFLSNQQANTSTLIIGPKQSQLFKRIIMEKNNKFKNIVSGMEGLISSINQCKLLIIQVNDLHEDFGTENVNGHYFVIEIDMENARITNEIQYNIADSLDDGSDDRFSYWKNVISVHKIDDFFYQIRPFYRFSYHRSENVSIQQINDANDCGIFGARRIFCLFNNGLIPKTHEIDNQVCSVRIFRIIILNALLKNSQYVSTYISPTGTSQVGFSDDEKNFMVPSPIKNRNFSEQHIVPKKLFTKMADNNIDKEINSDEHPQTTTYNIDDFSITNIPSRSPKSTQSSKSSIDMLYNE